jgi:hypothetical protein
LQSIDELIRGCRLIFQCPTVAFKVSVTAEISPFHSKKTWLQIGPERYVFNSETLLHHANQEQRTGRMDGKLSSKGDGWRATTVEAKAEHVLGCRESYGVSRGAKAGAGEQWLGVFGW